MRPELGGGCWSDTDSCVVVKTEQNPITHCILHKASFLVLVCSHYILGQQQPVADILQESVVVTKLLIHSSHLGRASCVGQQGWRSTAIDNLKRGSSKGGLE